MKILITGAKGFIGQNLVVTLEDQKQHTLYLVDVDTSLDDLTKFTRDCDFVFHLAGVNRSENIEDFMKGNYGFTQTLLDLLEKHGNKSTILITSSIQASLDNPYGISKKAGEDLVKSFSQRFGNKIYVYRLFNLFGKWSRPNYNSVVATFCYNISHDLPIQINDPNTILELVHIDDVIAEFIKVINGEVDPNEDFYSIPQVTKISLQELSNKLFAFRKTRETFYLPELKTRFDRQLYGTYLSYLDPNNFGYSLKKSSDQRGWLAEFVKSSEFGQVFVSKTFPGITRGNHWHHRKAEKFLVIQGTGIISFRNILKTEIIEYIVDGQNPKVIDIPTGYTHNIKNTGTDILITLFWSTEVFDPQDADTHFQEV